MASLTCLTCRREQPADSNFCNQCGAPLRPAGVPRAPLAAGARTYTPKHLADKILQTRSALVGERKQVTVLFADVKESMALAERVDAEEWHRILDQFFTLVADGIHRFEGTINQFTGDGVMALFGAPLAHEDHAQRACHAALQLRAQVRRYAHELKRRRGLPFAVRMGLNSGEVIVGTIGDDLRMDYTAQGHTVGLAARMQQIAAAGAIYLTGHTAALVASFFELEPVGRIRLKGVRQPVATFALVEARPIRTRLEASRARGFSRFVGRADEVALLDAALSRAVSGHGQVVGVVGPAGVGKSRLCQEVIERWRAEGLAVAEAHCPAHGKSLPHGALIDLLRSFFALGADERPSVARRQVKARLRAVQRALEAEAPLLLDFLGWPDPKRPPPPVDDGARRARLFTILRRLVQAQSGLEPTVLLLDDVHWVDRDSDAFLAELVDAVGWTRTLVLLNFRPEYSAPWMQTAYYQPLQLAPLDEGASDALLRELLGDAPAVAPVGAAIKERAAGNPFFIEEIVHSLVAQGVLVRERAGWRVTQPVTAVRIPATVQALLGARIDSLPEPAKYVLQTAAVIGKRFAEPVLRLTLQAEASPCGQAGGGLDVAAALRLLQGADLIHAGGTEAQREYVFKHPLTQEVAYAAQLQETRQRMHAAVAGALEVVYADRLGAHAALLAHHWEAANQPYDARLWRRRAALRVTNIQTRRRS